MRNCEIRIIVRVINTEEAVVLSSDGNSPDSTRTIANACNEYFLSVF